MNAAPLRLLIAAAWPLTIWTSFTHFDEHPADDYVERTFPILATSVAFWVCVAGLIAVALTSHVSIVGDDGTIVRHTRQSNVDDVLIVFLPVIYVVGLWLFSARADRFER